MLLLLLFAVCYAARVTRPRDVNERITRGPLGSCSRVARPPPAGHANEERLIRNDERNIPFAGA